MLRGVCTWVRVHYRAQVSEYEDLVSKSSGVLSLPHQPINKYIRLLLAGVGFVLTLLPLLTPAVVVVS